MKNRSDHDIEAPNPLRLRASKNIILLIGLTLLAAISAIMLTGVSVWFLGAVALVSGTPAALTFNFHHPGVLIRFLALARTGAKYGERLLGHELALAAQTWRRDRLFHAIAMAPETRARAWQLGQEHHLADFMEDVAHLDFAPLRHDLPLLGIITGTVLILVASLFISPLLALLLVAALAATILALRHLQREIAAQWASIHSGTRSLSEDLGQSFAAFTALAGSEHRQSQVHTVLKAMADRREQQRLMARNLAWAEVLVGAIGPAFAVLTMLVAWVGGARGHDLLPAAGVAFFWVALAEISSATGAAILGGIQRKTAKQTLEQPGRTRPAAGQHDAPGTGGPVQQISLQGFRLTTADNRLLQNVDMQANAGQMLVLAGPSGSGKTTLLKFLAGWLQGADGVFYDGQKASTDRLRASSCLIQHDAAILHGTIRENLFAPAASNAELWQALDAVEMSDRIRTQGGLGALLRGNSDLSQGEAHRLSLARALLSEKPVLLLDEPGEHLDAGQAGRILARMQALMQDRIIIATSHQANALSTSRNNVMVNLGQ